MVVSLHENRRPTTQPPGAGCHPRARAAAHCRRRIGDRGDAELRPLPHHGVQVLAEAPGARRGPPALPQAPRPAPPPHAAAEGPGLPLAQRQGPAAVRLRLRPVDPATGGGPRRGAVRHLPRGDRHRAAPRRAGDHPPRSPCGGPTSVTPWRWSAGSARRTPRCGSGPGAGAPRSSFSTRRACAPTRPSSGPGPRAAGHPWSSY